MFNMRRKSERKRAARALAEYPYLVRRWMHGVYGIIACPTGERGVPDLSAIQRMVDETGYSHCLALRNDLGLYFHPGAEPKLADNIPSMRIGGREYMIDSREI